MAVSASTARRVTYDPPTGVFQNFNAPVCRPTDKHLWVGARVTVYDQHSSIVGTGAITSSSWTDLKTEHDDGMPGIAGMPNSGVPADTSVSGNCRVTFAVRGLPTATFYGIVVGDTAKVIYSVAELTAKKWTVNLSS